MVCCDSLSNLYLWHIKYSGMLWRPEERKVVIRFQICIFDILNTAILSSNMYNPCCDSLSNLYLWHIKYSPISAKVYSYTVVIRFQICIFDILNTATPTQRIKPTIVVIRFQICIFDILNTAIGYLDLGDNPLWFAFKFVSLTY